MVEYRFVFKVWEKLVLMGEDRYALSCVYKPKNCRERENGSIYVSNLEFGGALKILKKEKNSLIESFSSSLYSEIYLLDDGFVVKDHKGGSFELELHARTMKRLKGLVSFLEFPSLDEDKIFKGKAA